MLDNKGFDLWADGYDEDVDITDDDHLCPFAGYKKILGMIYQKVMEKPGATVLDLGFGTGKLAAKLYENGCMIYGQDFSEKMIHLAQDKMPKAYLCQGDFAKGLVEPLKQQRYDFIIATYSLHHLTDEQKIHLLKQLQGYLKDGGMILIGDVAFETRSELNACALEAGNSWDDEEIYFVVEEIREAFPSITFTKVSYCAGVLKMTK